MQDAWLKTATGQTEEELLWETFHENSKTSPFDQFPSNEMVYNRMKKMNESLPYDYCPRISLPNSFKPIEAGLKDVIVSRTSSKKMKHGSISLEDLGSILFHACGENRDNKNTSYPRPFRTCPSGGGLYPIELFLYIPKGTNKEIPEGIYHYNPHKHDLALIKSGNFTSKIANGLVQPEFALNASILIFYTALFERTTFKYGERGYRFVFIEAGHMAQNVNLVATGLNLEILNIGGFFDRSIDDILEIDGLNHGTVYINSIGHKI